MFKLFNVVKLTLNVFFAVNKLLTMRHLKIFYNLFDNIHEVR